MLFKNKIEYTKGMFVEIYGTEIKKVRLVLRIITAVSYTHLTLPTNSRV